MKKLIILCICILMVFVVVGCGEETDPLLEPGEVIQESDKEEDEEEGEIIGGEITNPMVQYDSLAKVNNMLDIDLTLPGVMGVTNEKYFVIESEIGELDFSLGGFDYVLRGSKKFTDISGIYIDGHPAFEEYASEKREYATSVDVKAARWLSEGKQYTLTVKDSGKMDQETFEGIVDEMVTIIASLSNEPSVAKLPGYYVDKIGQRATAEITASEDNVANIEISWASSYNETTKYVMNALITEDGHLTYYDEEKYLITYDEEGNETSNIQEYNDKTGYFVFVGADLAWEGAYDEGCRTCVFELIPQITE